MDETTELDWLTLSRLPGCTASVRRRLQCVEDSGTDNWPGRILDAPDSTWRAAGAGPELLLTRRSLSRRGSRHPARQQALIDQEILRASGAELLALGTREYPALLAEIHDPPPLLYLRGNRETLLLPQLAVVGSRRHSSAAGRAARDISMQLVASGFCISSGMALGIDAVAHRAALDAGGATLAVMATGIDLCYPRRHAALAAAIREQGLLLTEFPPGTEPRREHFPQRNRLISGLSAGVLVAEAARRSGSLITARLGLEQNREVFALPHSIYDPGGAGCNALIQQGAKLVESAADIVEEVASLRAAQLLRQGMRQEKPELPAALARVYDAVGYEPVSVDQLVLAGQGDAAELMAGLVELQVLGLVENRTGLYMRKCG